MCIKYIIKINAMKKLVILCVIFLTAAFTMNAQTVDRKWSVGLYGGANQYAGDWGNGFYRLIKGFTRWAN